MARRPRGQGGLSAVSCAAICRASVALALALALAYLAMRRLCRRARFALVLLLLLISVWVAVACGDSSVPSPFEKDAGSDVALSDVNDAGDPSLGGPCLDDGQCDDGLECTLNRCDLKIQRCRFTPDNS